MYIALAIVEFEVQLTVGIPEINVAEGRFLGPRM
jgi:hypothetical protein